MGDRSYIGVDGEFLLLAHPDEQDMRRLRCQSGTRLLVRQVTAEDPDPHLVA